MLQLGSYTPSFISMCLVRYRRSPSLALCLCLAALIAACGDSQERSHEDATVAPIHDAGVLALDAASPPFSSFDAAAPQVVTASLPSCRPGSYVGEFKCLISGLVPWGGTMSFSLVQETSWTGGEFETLQILPGTRINGTDETFSGTFSANLQGKFSCQTGILTGSLDDGTYVANGGLPFTMAGDLEGRYVADAGTPGFEGTMGPLRSPDFDILGGLAPMAMCTWTASRVGDVQNDAGIDASP